MKKILLLFFTLAFSWSIFASALVDKEGKITPSLLSLFELLNIPHGGSLKEIAQSARANWWQLGERWNFKPRFPEKEAFIHDLLQEMGCFSAITASQKEYEYAFVLGSLASNVRKRIGALLDEWNRGVRWNKIIFLTGDRLLHPQKETFAVLTDAENKELPIRKNWVFCGSPPQTETEMMLLIWDQADLPKELRDLPIIAIDAPPVSLRGRPTTETTISKWLKMNPSPGSCIAFSSQPFVGYQHAIFATLLPSSFSIETAGRGGGKEFPTSVLLDNIAKWLYWEVRQQEKHSR